MNMGQITTPIIHQVEELVRDVPGWTPIDQLYTLYNMAYFTRGVSGDILELGSWCGRSAVALGLAARSFEDTHVFCFDLFPERGDWFENPDGTYAFEVTVHGQRFRAPKTHTIWKSAFERDIAPVYRRNESTFAIFMQTIKAAELSEVVVPCRGDSSLMRSVLPPGFKCKLAFIDADHSYDAVSADIQHVDEHLVNGGWICFDDAFSGYEGVSRAIQDHILGNPRFELAQQMTRKLFVVRKK